MVSKGGSKMPKFKPYRENQVMLFPESIDDYVPENHPSRTIEGLLPDRTLESFIQKSTDGAIPIF